MIMMEGDPKLTENEVKVLDSPYIQRMDPFFSNGGRIEELQAFLNNRGHNLTLSETQAFFPVAREHTIAVYDHETFEESQAYMVDEAGKLAERAHAAFDGNEKLLVNHYKIYRSFLVFWMEGNLDIALGPA